MRFSVASDREQREFSNHTGREWAAGRNLQTPLNAGFHSAVGSGHHYPAHIGDHDRMTRQVPADASRSQARQAAIILKVAHAMSAHGVAALPRNYELFYEALSGRLPQLSRELAEARAQSATGLTGRFGPQAPPRLPRSPRRGPGESDSPGSPRRHGQHAQACAGAEANIQDRTRSFRRSVGS